MQFLENQLNEAFQQVLLENNRVYNIGVNNINEGKVIMELLKLVLGKADNQVKVVETDKIEGTVNLVPQPKVFLAVTIAR